MKAIVSQNYGSPDVLKLEEIEKPTAGNDEVLIKVRSLFFTKSALQNLASIDEVFRVMPQVNGERL